MQHVIGCPEAVPNPIPARSAFLLMCTLVSSWYCVLLLHREVHMDTIAGSLFVVIPLAENLPVQHL